MRFQKMLCKHTHNSQDNKSVHQSKRRRDRGRVAYDAQTGVANRGNGRRRRIQLAKVAFRKL